MWIRERTVLRSSHCLVINVRRVPPQPQGISKVCRTIHGVRVEIRAVDKSQRIFPQEPPRRRIVVPRPVVVESGLRIELPPRIGIGLLHRAGRFQEIAVCIIRIRPGDDAVNIRQLRHRAEAVLVVVERAPRFGNSDRLIDAGAMSVSCLEDVA